MKAGMRALYNLRCYSWAGPCLRVGAVHAAERRVRHTILESPQV